MSDRSSRPHRLRRPTEAATVERIEALRRQRWTGKRFAMTVGSSSATVSRVLRRLGISKMKDLEPPEFSHVHHAKLSSVPQVTGVRGLRRSLPEASSHTSAISMRLGAPKCTAAHRSTF